MFSSKNPNFGHLVSRRLHNKSVCNLESNLAPGFLEVGECCKQRWSRGHKARGQGQGHKKNPRPRTALPRTDSLEAMDRNARGQGQGPRTQAQVLSEKRKKGLHKNFSGALQKKEKGLHKIFLGDLQKKRLPKHVSGASQYFNNSKKDRRIEPKTGQFSRT